MPRRCVLLGCDVRCPPGADCVGCRIDIEETIAIKVDSHIPSDEAKRQTLAELRARLEVVAPTQGRLALG